MFQRFFLLATPFLLASCVSSGLEKRVVQIEKNFDLLIQDNERLQAAINEQANYNSANLATLEIFDEFIKTHFYDAGQIRNFRQLFREVSDMKSKLSRIQFDRMQNGMYVIVASPPPPQHADTENNIVTKTLHVTLPAR